MWTATCVWLIALMAQSAAGSPLAPSGLRCEYLVDPIGIDVTSPRLFWTPQHTGRGINQAAYQILVSSRPEAQTGDQWDSGRVASGEFTQVVYAGKPLASARTYYWKVRYWDQDGQVSPYSATGRFETGLLGASDWKAKWIRGGNQLRREFSLPARPVRARAFVSGIGFYELRLNGRKVGDHVLDPA
jgi:alpha-L-rhamnosidase